MRILGRAWSNPYQATFEFLVIVRSWMVGVAGWHGDGRLVLQLWASFGPDRGIRLTYRRPKSVY